MVEIGKWCAIVVGRLPVTGEVKSGSVCERIAHTHKGEKVCKRRRKLVFCCGKAPRKTCGRNLPSPLYVV